MFLIAGKATRQHAVRARSRAEGAAERCPAHRLAVQASDIGIDIDKGQKTVRHRRRLHVKVHLLCPCMSMGYGVQLSRMGTSNRDVYFGSPSVPKTSR
jgi:hypothetical protein